MKKAFISLALILLLVMIAVPAMANPWQRISGVGVVREGRTIPADLLFNGEKLEVDGVIRGDLIVFAREVKINGRVEGSLLGLVYGRLTVDGEVRGNLRVIANQLAVAGKVGKSVTVAALLMETGPKALVEQGLLGVFSQAELRGGISGPVDVTGYEATTIGAKIDGNLRFHGAPVQWRKGAAVTGSIDDYTGNTENTAGANQVKLGGDYRVHFQREAGAKILKTLFIISLVWFLGNVLISLIFYRFFPHTAWKISEPTVANFRKNLTIGILTLIGIPLVIFLMAITIVGIPLAVLLGLGYLILLLFAGTPLNLWVGRLFFKKIKVNSPPVLQIVVGALLMALVGMVPFIGNVFQVIGMGMIISNLKPEFGGKEPPKIDLGERRL